jgi:protease PrsW
MMASWPEALVIAVAPSIFLLWFFHHKDRYKNEPVWFMVKVFILGALFIAPAVIVEFAAYPLLQPDNGLLESTLFFFVVVGPVEELGKFGAVRLRAYSSAQFNEPMDGIVLGVSGALGFATVENILDVFRAPTPEAQLFTGIVRGFLSVPGHAFWGAIIGFYLGQAKFLKRPRLAFVGVGIAVLLHGTFDATSSVVEVVGGDSAAAAFFGLLVLVGIVWLTYWIVKREISEAEDESPFRRKPSPSRRRRGRRSVAVKTARIRVGVGRTDCLSLHALSS